MDDTEHKQSGLAIVSDSDCVTEVILAFEDHVLLEVEVFFLQQFVIILNDMDLWRGIVAYFASWGVDPVFEGVGVDEESDVLGHGQGDAKVSLVFGLQLEHILVELMPVVGFPAFLELTRVELVLPFLELSHFFVVDFLSDRQLLLGHHLLHLFVLSSFSLLHLLHGILVGLVGFLLPDLYEFILLLVSHVS